MGDYETSMSYVAQEKRREGGGEHPDGGLKEAGPGKVQIQTEGKEEQMESLADQEVNQAEKGGATAGDLVFLKGSNTGEESTQNHDSFVNMGRPSDMNEDRIISKETQDAIARENIRKEMLKIKC